jgi:protein required for attachment to host cells
MKQNIWIVVADGSRARVLETSSPLGSLQEVTALVHPEARLHERDLRTDAPGQVHDRTGNAFHSTIDKEPVKAHEIQVFAREVANFLLQAWQVQRFQHWLLIASPEFLGQLRGVLDPKLKDCICLEMAKDYTQLRPEEIRNRLPERLPLQTQSE